MMEPHLSKNSFAGNRDCGATLRDRSYVETITRCFLDLTSKGICASLYLYNGRRNSCCTMSVQPTLLTPIADDAAVVIVTLRQYVKSCCADGITIVELYRYLGMMQPSYRMTLKSYDGRVFAHITRGSEVLSVMQV